MEINLFEPLWTSFHASCFLISLFCYVSKVLERYINKRRKEEKRDYGSPIWPPSSPLFTKDKQLLSQRVFFYNMPLLHKTSNCDCFGFYSRGVGISKQD